MIRILAGLLIFVSASVNADVAGKAMATKAGIALLYQMSALASPSIETPKPKPTPTNALGWNLGDSLSYRIIIKPLPLKGAMRLAFTHEDHDTMTLEQDMDFKVFKLKIESIMDKETGAIKKIKIDGKEQKAGGPLAGATGGGDAAASTRIVKMEEAHVNVPAGGFDCIYAVMEDGAKNQSQAWINPRDIPLSGMLKTQVVAGDLLTVVMELVSFERGH